MAVEADVTKKATLDAMVAAVVQKYGKVDILVNNAGIESVPMLLKDMNLLNAVLPDHVGAREIDAIAARFLAAANPGV